MAEALRITLPAASTSDGARSISEALTSLPEVQSAEPSRTRADPASVLLFVQLAGSVFSAVATAVPIVQKIIGTIRGKGIKGAVIEFPGGVKLSVDSASVADIEQLIRAARV
jgi:hypothetical protein